MSNQSTSTGKYNEQIGELEMAIEYLKEADNLLGYEDDGSGKEYTDEQHKKGFAQKEKALGYIQKANMVLINEV